MKTIEQQREERRLKRQAKLAAMTPEQWKELFSKNSARRSAIRAAKALAEGRTPGKPGTRTFTDEELKISTKAAQMRYREKNIDKIRERDVKIKRDIRETAEGRAKLCVVQMKYAAKNKDKIKTRDKIWRAANAQKLITYMAKYYKTKKEHLNKQQKDHYAANKAVYAEYRRNYHARKVNALGTHTAADIRELFFEQKGMCGLCDLALDANSYHVDHWKPLSKGGSNDKSNLKLLHPKCNLSKGAKLPSEFNKRSA